MHRIFPFLSIFGIVAASSFFDFPDLSRRIPERAASPGCAYKGEKYEHGQQVETSEACLNCTCTRAVVVCYLRVCSTASAPPAGCFLARELGQCCPSLVCGGEDISKATSDSLLDLRPTFQPQSSENDSIIPDTGLADKAITKNEILTTVSGIATEKSATFTDQIVTSEESTSTGKMVTENIATTTVVTTEDSNINEKDFGHLNEKDIGHLNVKDFGHLNDSLMFVSSTEKGDHDFEFLNSIPGGCLVNGTLYGDGSAMLSSSFCEYCFCIRGKTTCLEPKCHLVIEGCTPHYDTEFSCCPSRYNCVQKGSSNDTEKTTTASHEITGCLVDDKVYHQGEVIAGYQDCHSCYCNDSSIICDQIKCSPPIQGCQPIIPEGHCCPVSYRCGEKNETAGLKESKTNTKHSTNETNSVKKTLKQSNIFRLTASSKNSSFNSEHTTFFFNVIRRRLDDEAAEFYSLSDVIHPSDIALQMPSGGNTANTRENDKTLDLENLSTSQTVQYPLNTTEYENAIDHTDTKPKLIRGENNNNRVISISTGIPETHTIPIEELVERYFTKHHTNISKSETESLESKRNNSKQPSTIIESTQLKPIFIANDKTGDEIQFNVTKSMYTDNSFPMTTINVLETNENEESNTTLYTSDADTQNSDFISETEKFDFPPSHKTESTTEAFQFTTPIPNDNKVTLDEIKKFTDSAIYESLYNQTVPQILERAASDSLENSNESSPRQNSSKEILDEISKIYTRINSKLAFSSQNNNKRQDDAFFPAESRDSGEDLINIGSIYLGAPLSVDDGSQKDMTRKVTESEGVIFLDPKYTDIHPSPADDSLGFTNTPIDRMDTVQYDRKKEPRVQDNHTLAIGYQIIPFVAEDAVRGINGNKTQPIKTENTQGFPDMVSDFCFIKGRIFMNGEMIPKSDPCELCRCFYGQELCQLQRCPSPPDCIPEKVPGFCCPRFTCGKNSTYNQHPSQTISQPNSPVLSLVASVKEKPVEASNSQEKEKFGIRVRPIIQDFKPPRSTLSTKSSESVTRPSIGTKPYISTSSPATKSDIIRSSSRTESVTHLEPMTKLTTKAPDTTAGSFFPDPWGLLKVSGCNIYGKYFNINEMVEILSGPCSHCICTANGVECNDIC